jgi:signal transduction histidine kinase
VNSFHTQWIGFANGLIAAKKGAGASVEAYTTLFEGQFRKQVGKNLNNKIAERLAEFDRIEYTIRNVHGNNLILSIKRTHAFSFIFFVLTILIGVITTYYVVSLITRRIKQMVILADNISKGNFMTVTDDQKDELTDLTTSLNVMSVNLQKNINELENRNAELDKFAYVVSHDLKAPIRGIHNVIQWIEEDLSNELSPQMSKYINIISGRIERMENLINGLLDYARIREKTAPVHIDTNALVSEIIEDIVPRNFEVELNNLPVIFGERLKIEQVFTNLISNSVKYASEERGKIVIGCREFKHDYEFSVKDNGVGIEPEFHEKIFEMFQTLREKGEKESTGIGLAIVKKIIDEQKGQIRVNSELGRGTEFVFNWPKIIDNE